MPTPKTISGHLKDLLRRDIQVTLDIIEWLSPSQREIDRRSRSRRLNSRFIAACMIAEAPKNPAVLRELLDRTEGKVADIVLTGNLGEIIKALEAGRQRLIEAKTPQDVVVEGEIVTPEDPLPGPTSTESDTTK